MCAHSSAPRRENRNWELGTGAGEKLAAVLGSPSFLKVFLNRPRPGSLVLLPYGPDHKNPNLGWSA